MPNYFSLYPIDTTQKGRVVKPSANAFTKAATMQLMTGEIAVPATVAAGRVFFSISEYISQAQQKLGGNQETLSSIINAILSVTVSSAGYDEEALAASIENSYDMKSFWGYEGTQKRYFETSELLTYVKKAYEFSITRNVLNAAISKKLFGSPDYLKSLSRIGTPLQFETLYSNLISMLALANTAAVKMSQSAPLTDLVDLFAHTREYNELFSQIESVIIAQSSISAHAVLLPMYDVISTLNSSSGTTNPFSMSLRRVMNTNIMEATTSYAKVDEGLIPIFRLYLRMISDITYTDLINKTGIETYVDNTERKRLTVSEIVARLREYIHTTNIGNPIVSEYDRLVLDMIGSEYQSPQQSGKEGENTLSVIQDVLPTLIQMSVLSNTTKYASNNAMGAKLKSTLQSTYSPQDLSIYNAVLDPSIQALGAGLTLLGDLFTTIKHLLNQDLLFYDVDLEGADLIAEMVSITDDKVQRMQEIYENQITFNQISFFDQGSVLLDMNAGSGIPLTVVPHDTTLEKVVPLTLMQYSVDGYSTLTVRQSSVAFIKVPRANAPLPVSIKKLGILMPGTTVHDSMFTAVMEAPFDLQVKDQRLVELVGLHTMDNLVATGLSQYFMTKSKFVDATTFERFLYSLRISQFGEVAEEIRPLFEPVKGMMALVLDPSKIFILISNKYVYLDDEYVAVKSATDSWIKDRIVLYDKEIVLRSEARVNQISIGPSEGIDLEWLKAAFPEISQAKVKTTGSERTKGKEQDQSDDLDKKEDEV